jgi:hypothetical protein
LTEKKENNPPHVYREDPHGDKEDIRPVEKRKKPRFEIDWEKLRGWIENE